MVSKTMQLVDNVLYSFGNAFVVFCAGGGVGVLVGRIEVGYLSFLTRSTGFEVMLMLGVIV